MAKQEGLGAPFLNVGVDLQGPAIGCPTHEPALDLQQWVGNDAGQIRRRRRAGSDQRH